MRDALPFLGIILTAGFLAFALAFALGKAIRSSNARQAAATCPEQGTAAVRTIDEKVVCVAIHRNSAR